MGRLRVLLFLSISACMGDGLTICGDVACPGGTVCDVAHHGCAAREQLEACSGALDHDPCTTVRIAAGECHEGTCFPAGCGNGRLDRDEICDDGNNLEGDGCSSDCGSTEVCGNGVVDPAVGEACDDGNLVDGDGCQANCHNPTCGDGIIDAQFNEACDDGAANSADPDAHCRANCQLARCGDGVTDPSLGEVCDDGNLSPGDGCRPDCASNEKCGNGQLDFATGELCDDDNLGSHDGCDSLCRVESYAWSTYSATAPIQMYGSGLAYDEARRTAVMFGGYTYYYNSGVTEELARGEVWRRASTTGPNGRYQPALAYDAARGVTVLFGGRDSYRYYGDTWIFDGRSWTTAGSASGPTPRTDTAMAYDSRRKRVVMFGGYSGTARLGDTLEWDGSVWRTITVSGASPSARQGAAMAYDPLRGEVVLFGGQTDSGASAETWTWNGTSWTARGTAAPSARVHHAMSFDPNAGGVVMSGGADGYPDANTLWARDATGWVAVATSQSLDRSGHNQYFDRDLNATVILRGGLGANDPTPDLYTWSPTMGLGVPSLLSSGPTGDGVALAYDSWRGRTVALDGVTTWELDGTAWHVIPSAHTPPARDVPARMTFDSKRGVSVLFGGTYADSSVWEWNGIDWTEHAVSGPTPRIETQLAFDTVRGVTILYGGYDQATGPRADMWTWNGTSWTELTGQDQPGPRFDAGFAYDEKRHRLVLFAGADGNAFLDTTWEWDGAWSQPSTSVAPPARFTLGLEYDPLRRVVVMQGGQTFGGTALADLYDTWTWDGVQWQKLPVDIVVGRNQRLVFERRMGVTLAVYAGTNVLRSTGPARDETCETGLDHDRDGLTGCADPDCWGYCHPACPPGLTCSSTLPSCGDGVCGAVESCRLCPGDCGACVAVCGDLMCDAGESAAICPGDCP